MRYRAKPLPPVDLPTLRQVGKPLRQVDALGKAVGATVYAGDYSMPNMLHAKVFLQRGSSDWMRARPGRCPAWCACSRLRTCQTPN
jgi:hypothetical protein